MEALPKPVQSSILCTQIVLPFGTALESDTWPQLLLTAGTSIQQDALLVSIQIIFLGFYWVSRAAC